MYKTENDRLWLASWPIVAALVIVLGILVAAAPVSAAKKMRTTNATHVYTHTYDEVFQAVLDYAARWGHLQVDSDKDKGTVTHGFKNRYNGCTYRVQVESISAKPETRLTLNLECSGLSQKDVDDGGPEYLSKIQKILATYR